MAPYHVFGLALFVLPILACGSVGPTDAASDSGPVSQSDAYAGELADAQAQSGIDAFAADVSSMGMPPMRYGGAGEGGSDTSTDVPESGMPLDSGGSVDSAARASDAMPDGAQAPVDAGSDGARDAGVCWTTCCDEVPGGPTGFMCVPYQCPTPCTGDQ